MSDAQSATGTLVKRGNGASPEVFTTVPELRGITMPGFSRNKLETTTHNDESESFVPGVIRQKDPGFKINYLADNTVHENIVADFMGSVKHNWQFIFKSGIIYEGPAYVQSFMIADAPVDAIQEADITLMWAGPVEITVPG